MQRIFLFTLFITLVCGISACNKTPENQSQPKQVDEKPAFDIMPQRAQLQKAKDLEKKMQQDAEDQRKIIELQANPK